jgi:hypothetical protein
VEERGGIHGGFELRPALLGEMRNTVSKLERINTLARIFRQHMEISTHLGPLNWRMKVSCITGPAEATLKHQRTSCNTAFVSYCSRNVVRSIGCIHKDVTIRAI